MVLKDRLILNSFIILSCAVAATTQSSSVSFFTSAMQLLLNKCYPQVLPPITTFIQPVLNIPRGIKALQNRQKGTPKPSVAETV